jgi:catechol 2,3-dioxygenase-like lactoylglutathione lyase family enzyme
MRGTPEIDGRDGHFAFRVASYDDTVARLRAHGITLVESPRNATPWAQIYVTDPDGNVIEFNVERS